VHVRSLELSAVRAAAAGQPQRARPPAARRRASTAPTPPPQLEGGRWQAEIRVAVGNSSDGPAARPGGLPVPLTRPLHNALTGIERAKN
jgi:hypothetical protein